MQTCPTRPQVAAKFPKLPSDRPDLLRCGENFAISPMNDVTESPMTTFDDREHAFEAKFAHDEEMKFKAAARCHKLTGLWAAELLGKSGADADAYALEVVMADFEEPGHEDVVRKLVGDLDGKADEAAIRAKLAEMNIKAKDEIMGEL
jgi:hypothetical protein